MGKTVLPVVQVQVVSSLSRKSLHECTAQESRKQLTGRHTHPHTQGLVVCHNQTLPNVAWACCAVHVQSLRVDEAPEAYLYMLHAYRRCEPGTHDQPFHEVVGVSVAIDT